MGKIRILIVDDEPLMCEELQDLLYAYPELETVAICHNGEEALAKGIDLQPDIVFLDIEMPGISGINVADVLARQTHPPRVIFLTAHDEYALQAFKVNALDYVLKPFDEEDIARVIAKVKRAHLQPAKGSNHAVATAGPVKRGEYVRRFCVQHGAKLEVIDQEQIQVFYARERLVFIQTIDGNSYPVRFTLSSLEEKVDPRLFVRCHRNYIVNVNQIKSLETWFNRGYMMVLKGQLKTEIPVSRQYVSILKEHLDF